jgi:outer membrane protein W
MAQRIYRIVFLLFVIAGSLRLFAQTPSSEVGVWMVSPKLSESALTDENTDLSIELDEQLGYGVSFNHYWTGRFSTELAAQTFAADAVIGFHSVEGEELLDAGELEATILTAIAQWHFNRDGRFAPYFGGGIAHLSGDVEVVDDPADYGSFDFESEITWAAAVGVDVRLTDRILLAAEMKYTPWSAIAENNGTGESLEIDPLVFGVGMKVRF